MKIYLVRYGEVNHNLYKLYNREDEDLNETGISEAYELKENISNISYDIIISSPLIRAKHTAQIINVKNREIIIENNGILLTVTVSSGTAFVSSSSCPDGICVATGKISKSGQIIVCAPANVAVWIEDGGENGYDAVTG